MMGFFSFEYLLDVIFMGIGFFTFIKLISSDVYLNNHKMLPTIAAVITIYDFYICLVPFMSDTEVVYSLRLLAGMCAMVTMYMMFFYLLFLKKPRFHKTIVIISTILMIGICVYQLILFKLYSTHDYKLDLIGVVVVFLFSIIVAIGIRSKKFFDKSDKIIAKLMLASFVIALIGYVSQMALKGCTFVLSSAFAIDCIIFFWMASTNRIEDTANILKGTLYDRMEYPIGLVNSSFYVIDTNEAAAELFPNGRGLGFAFENGNFHEKFLLLEQLVTNNDNDREYIAGENWYRVHWTAVYGEKGVKGYIVSATDVTVQHIKVQDARKETVEKSQFLAYMSHELRSPLHSIMGISNILMDKNDLTSKNHNLVYHIKKSAETLLELVDSILDFSKIETGKFAFTVKEYDVKSFFEDLTYNNLVNIQSKPIDFSVNIKTDFPKTLSGDTNRVKEVFQNIISNAIKYTEKGSISVGLSFEKAEGKRIRVVFSVRDTGSGMTKAQLDDLFKDYFSASDDKVIEGTGLGMSITKEILSRMDGHIFAESDGKTGSRFYGDFYQEVVSDEMEEKCVFNRRTIFNNSHGAHNGLATIDFVYPDANILLVDDMRINLEILNQFLLPWQCNVTMVTDGYQAIEAVKENDFDLIFIDRMMAPMSGTELCDNLKPLTNAPMIMMSASTESDCADVVEEHGFNAFLAKPIHGIELKSMLEKYLPSVKAKPVSTEDGEGDRASDKTKDKVYRKALNDFVFEMEPLLLRLPSYRQNDKTLFEVKIHGIIDASRQIGREGLAEKALIMEMAIKSGTWEFVDKYFDDFLGEICDTVEEITVELSQLSAV